MGTILLIIGLIVLVGVVFTLIAPGWWRSAGPPVDTQLRPGDDPQATQKPIIPVHHDESGHGI